jgi:hypothetical protein
VVPIITENKKKKQTNQANDAKNKQKQFESTNWDTWKQKDEEVKYTIIFGLFFLI